MRTFDAPGPGCLPHQVRSFSWALQVTYIAIRSIGIHCYADHFPALRAERVGAGEQFVCGVRGNHGVLPMWTGSAGCSSFGRTSRSIYACAAVCFSHRSGMNCRELRLLRECDGENRMDFKIVGSAADLTVWWVEIAYADDFDRDSACIIPSTIEHRIRELGLNRSTCPSDAKLSIGTGG